MFLNVRDKTKTGRRTVPAVCGDVIEKIKEDLCEDQSPDAPLFQDFGRKADSTAHPQDLLQRGLRTNGDVGAVQLKRRHQHESLALDSSRE